MRVTNTLEIKKVSSKLKSFVTGAKLRVNCLKETAEAGLTWWCCCKLYRLQTSLIQLSVVSEMFTCYCTVSTYYTPTELSTLTKTKDEPRLLQSDTTITVFARKAIDCSHNSKGYLWLDVTRSIQSIAPLWSHDWGDYCSCRPPYILALFQPLSLLANPTNNFIFLVITFETLSLDKREDTGQFCYPVILSIYLESVTYL